MRFVVPVGHYAPKAELGALTSVGYLWIAWPTDMLGDFPRWHLKHLDHIFSMPPWKLSSMFVGWAIQIWSWSFLLQFQRLGNYNISEKNNFNWKLILLTYIWRENNFSFIHLLNRIFKCAGILHENKLVIGSSMLVCQALSCSLEIPRPFNSFYSIPRLLEAGISSWLATPCMH